MKFPASTVALSLSLATTACAPGLTTTAATTTETRRDSVLVVERDTIVVSEPDSALLWAWVECDSLGRVLLDELQAERGRRVALEPRVVQNGRQTLIRVRAAAEPETTVVRRVETRRVAAAESRAATERVAAAPRGSGLRSALAGMALFVVGGAAGYVLRALRR